MNSQLNNIIHRKIFVQHWEDLLEKQNQQFLVTLLYISKNLTLELKMILSLFHKPWILKSLNCGTMPWNKRWILWKLTRSGILLICLGFKTIGCKWVFKTKKDSLGNIERYKAIIVAKEFTKKWMNWIHTYIFSYV